MSIGASANYTALYSNLSASIPLTLCSFVDYGISNDNNADGWSTKSANLTNTVYDSFTELSQTGTSATYLGIDIPSHCKILFDIYQNGLTTSSYFFRIDNASWGGYYGGDSLGNIDGALQSWIPVEILFEDKEIYTTNLQTGTTSQDTATAPSTINNPVFRFWLANGKTLRYKNFRVIEL